MTERHSLRAVIQAARDHTPRRINPPRTGDQLTDLETAVLTFALRVLPGVTLDGREYDLVVELTGLDMTHYLQLLAALTDDPRALAYDPPGVARLRRERDTRAAARWPHRRLTPTTTTRYDLAGGTR